MRKPASGPSRAPRRGRAGAAGGAGSAVAAPARPASSRPAASRRSGGSGPPGTTRTSAPRPRGQFTTRAVVLGVVLAALALSYVFPLRVYLAQQAEIADLRAAQAEQRAHIDDLAQEAALWSDDDYIRTQARKRLYFGEPGETLLIVPEEDQGPPVTGFDPDDVPEPEPVWWETLWGGIRLADSAGEGR